MDICGVLFVHPYPCVIPYFWSFVVFGFEMVNDCVCVSIYHETNSAVNISESGDFVVFFGYFYFAVHADVDIISFFIHKVCLLLEKELQPFSFVTLSHRELFERVDTPYDVRSIMPVRNCRHES